MDIRSRPVIGIKSDRRRSHLPRCQAGTKRPGRGCAAESEREHQPSILLDRRQSDCVDTSLWRLGPQPSDSNLPAQLPGPTQTGKQRFRLRVDQRHELSESGVESNHDSGSLLGIPLQVHDRPSRLTLQLDLSGKSCATAMDSTVNVPWTIVGLGGAELEYLAVNNKTESDRTTMTGSVGGVLCDEGRGQSGGDIPLAGFALASDGRGAITTTLSAPSNLAAEQLRDGTVKLTWNRVRGAGDYEVWFKRRGGTWSKTEFAAQPEVGTNPSHFFNRNVVTPGRYDFRVRARKNRARTPDDFVRQFPRSGGEPSGNSNPGHRNHPNHGQGASRAAGRRGRRRGGRLSDLGVQLRSSLTRTSWRFRHEHLELHNTTNCVQSRRSDARGSTLRIHESSGHGPN